MPKHNQAIQRNHFRKDWAEIAVRTWFNQPAKKSKRRVTRASKAAAIFPRPLQNLRPVVHCPTIKYNRKVRLGRGFSLAELTNAGIRPAEALSLGISLDKRRKNNSEKSLRVNVQRLKEYKSKLVLFPKNPAKPKKGDATKEEQTKVAQHSGVVLPLKAPVFRVETMDLKDIDHKTSAYTTLRKARQDAKLIGVREQKKKEKDDKEAASKKKEAKQSIFKYSYTDVSLSLLFA